MRATAIGLVVVALVAGIPATSWAQAGFYLIPSFSLAEEFDDNVFVTPTHKSADLISRFTPGIELGYRSEPFTLLARSSFDAEVFADNTQLNDVAARKRAALEMTYLPFRLLTVGLRVSYVETTTPSGLVAAAGTQFARTNATELVVAPAVTYQVTPTDTARLGYSFTRDTIETGPTNLTHRVEPSFAHQFTTLDTGALMFRASVFETEGSPTVSSYTPMGSYVRQLTPVTFLTLRAGPRFIDDGSVHPEAFGRIEHTYKMFRFALEYVRTDSVLLGHPGPVELETVSGSVAFEPLRLLTVKFEPAYARTFGGVLLETTTIKTYGFALSAAYPIMSWLTARFAYRFAYQPETGPDLSHNIVTISLDASYPIRLGQ